MRNPFTTTLPEPKYYIIFESPDAVNLRSNIVIYKLRIIRSYKIFYMQINITIIQWYVQYQPITTYKSKYYFIRSMLKSEKRCNLGRPHCLSPRLKKKIPEAEAELPILAHFFTFFSNLFYNPLLCIIFLILLTMPQQQSYIDTSKWQLVKMRWKPQTFQRKKSKIPT